MKRTVFLCIMAATVLTTAGCGGPGKKESSAAPGSGASSTTAAVPSSAAGAASDKTSKAAESGASATKTTVSKSAAAQPPSSAKTASKHPETANGLGIPVYPGAALAEDQRSSRGLKDVAGARAVDLTTQDKYADVIKWYRAHFKGVAMTAPAGVKPRETLIAQPDENAGEVRSVRISEGAKYVQVSLVRRKLPKNLLKQLRQLPQEQGQLPATTHVDQNPKDATARVGLPVFPGAAVARGEIVTDSRAPSLERIMVALSTNAKATEILKWYKDHMKNARSFERPMGNVKISGLGYSVDDAKTVTRYSVSVAEQDQKTFVLLVKLRLPKNGPPPPAAPK